MCLAENTPQEMWNQLLDRLRGTTGGHLVYVAGAMDTGKTTVCRRLLQELSRTATVAYVDCDPGQAFLGPPTTVGLTTVREGRFLEPLLRFIGSVSLAGHMLPMLTGVKRLVDRARELAADIVVCDLPGYVHGDAAREFHLHLLDLLQPQLVLAMQREDELRPLLRAVAGRPLETLSFPVLPSVVRRTPGERRRYRRERFAYYFAAARSQRLALTSLAIHGRCHNLQSAEEHRYRVVALLDHGNFVLVLGIVEALDARTETLQVLAPPFPGSGLAAVQFGSIRLSPTDWEH